MIFRNALIGHFDIWNSFSKRRWWFWHFSKGYPLEISPKWTEKKISEYQKSDLVSQNGRLIPVRFTQETMWSLRKKSHNNCLDLVDSIINTLYTPLLLLALASKSPKNVFDMISYLQHCCTVPLDLYIHRYIHYNNYKSYSYMYAIVLYIYATIIGGLSTATTVYN